MASPDENGQPTSGQPKQSRSAGNVYKVASVIAGIATFILFMIAYESDDFPVNMLLGVCVLGGIGLTMYLHGRGARHHAPSATEVMTSDGRAPIIYLRSFDTEDDLSGGDELLAKIVEDAGPLVAIGRPGDKLPPLGASRLYVADGQWKQTVTGLLDKAALVILRAGKTEGLLWELQQCRKRVPQRNLAVLIPANKSVYESFRQSAIEAGFPINLPEYPSKELVRFGAGDLAAIVHFDSHWNGTITPFEKATFKGSSYEIATSNTRAEPRMRLAMQPIARQAGLPIRPPRTNFLAIGLWSYFGLAFIFLLVMVFLLWAGYLE